MAGSRTQRRTPRLGALDFDEALASERGHDARIPRSRKRRQDKETGLLYHAYELQRAWLNGASAWASIASEMLSNPRHPIGYMGMGPMAASALEVFAPHVKAAGA